MKILITGAEGFIGQNLTARLQAYSCREADQMGIELYRCGRNTSVQTLERWCSDCDFVFHLAGVNRPEREEAFWEGNRDFTVLLMHALEKAGNTSPVLMSSSVQASRETPYGLSKRAGEAAVRAHASRMQSKALIYRLPSVFGKWCRPNYNSVVATFCHQIARGQPIRIDNAETELHLAFIDDVVQEFLNALNGRECIDADGNGVITETYSIRLGALAEMLAGLRDSRITLRLPKMDVPFERKLYSTFLSYLPERDFQYPLVMHADARGSFTEALRTSGAGQISVNVSKPGVVKGNHYHNVKVEKFLVVAGGGVIRLRRVGTSEVYAYPVSAERLEIVDIPAGYTHSLENTGASDMVTVMWCSECFDPAHPDTYFEEV